MKKLKNTIVIVCIVVACIAVAAVYRHFSLKTNTVRAAFYGLTETEVSVLSSWLDGRGVDWKAFVLDIAKPLSASVNDVSRYDLLFICDGANMDSVKSIVRNADTAALQILPLPVRISIQTDGRLTGVPVLTDPFQLLCSKNGFAKLQMSAPLSLALLEEAGVRELAGTENQKSIPAPFLCAGSNDDHLIMLFSSLLEAVEGIETWENAVSLLAAQTDAAVDSFFSSVQVRSVINRLALWQKKGLLSAAWLELTVEEAESAMEKDTALAVFAPYGFYRSVNEKAAKNYKLWYMPATAAEKRFLTARTIAVLQFSVLKSPLQSAVQARNKSDVARALIREAVSSPAQTKLAQSVVSVPVNANAQSDVSAAVSLGYLCASDGIIPDIAQAALTSKERRSFFARTLREKIREAATL